AAQIQWIEADRHRFVNRGREIVYTPFAGQHAVPTVLDHVEHAAAADRDDRCAGCERLDDGDAEVLDARLEKQAGAAVERAQLAVLDAAEKLHVGTGERREPPPLWTVAGAAPP